MGGPRCVNGKCLIQGGTIAIDSPGKHPQKRATVTTFKIGQAEVSIGDYKRFVAHKSGAQLQAVLSGCTSGHATRTIPGNAGGTMDQLRRRASQVFVSGQCGGLKVEQVVSQGLRMNGCCGEMNGKGDNYLVVCLTMQEKSDYCQAQGGDIMTVDQFEYLIGDGYRQIKEFDRADYSAGAVCAADRDYDDPLLRINYFAGFRCVWSKDSK